MLQLSLLLLKTRNSTASTATTKNYSFYDIYKLGHHVMQMALETLIVRTKLFIVTVSYLTSNYEIFHQWLDQQRYLVKRTRKLVFWNKKCNAYSGGARVSPIKHNFFIKRKKKFTIVNPKKNYPNKNKGNPSPIGKKKSKSPLNCT